MNKVTISQLQLHVCSFILVNTKTFQRIKAHSTEAMLTSTAHSLPCSNDLRTSQQLSVLN